MGFAVPAFLAGLLLAGIPFLVHLLFRRRAPQVPFAATRFIMAASRRTARRRRIDNVLLLALRTLLLGLLAFGLAGPYLRRATGSGRSGSDVVVVLDNSLSMSAASKGSVAFTRAKEAVDAILSKLKGGDLVAIIPAAPPESAGETGFGADVAASRERLARIAVSDARGPLALALGRAAALFEKSTSSEKVLFVVTDLQANCFPQVLDDAARAALAGAAVIVYDCGFDSARNLSVSALSVLTQGVVVGTPLEVRATVVSNSPVEETVPVVLSLSGRPLAGRAVTIPAGSSAVLSLSAIVPSAGIIDAAVEVQTTDAIAHDNRRFFCLVGRDRIKALILKSRDRSPEFDDDAFFLRRALDPFVAGAAGGRGPFEVTAKTYAEAPSLSAYDIVYLLLREGVDEDLGNSLAGYLAGGGSVVAFACEDAPAAGLRPWLPARLVALRSGNRSAGESFTLVSIDTEHSSMAVFRGEPASLYNRVRVYDYWLVDVADKSAGTLARLDTGDAAAVVSSAAPGRAILFSFAPIRSMSNLPASQFFLPMLYEMSYYLVASSSGLAETFAGNPLALAPAGVRSGGLVVTAPDGQQRLVTAGPGSPLLWESALLGPYRVREPDAQGDTSAFSVNTDPAESDLRRIGRSELAKRLPGRTVLFASSRETLDDALASLQPVLALGDAILYAVVAVALSECLAASRVSQKSAKRR